MAYAPGGVTDPGGPHLHAALICERLLTEQDGVVSAIRLIDRIFMLTDAHDEPINPQYQCTLLLSFKAGAARGSFNVEIVRENPSVERSSVLTAPVYFEGEDRGANLVVNMLFESAGAGLYWFDVLFEGERVTRIPLRVIYQRAPQLPTDD